MSPSIRNTASLALLALLAAVPVAAQEPGGLIEVLKSTRLPTATREARVLGVPEQDLRTILTAGREQRISSGVLAEVILESNQSIREHGPIDNFGAFVQDKLASGLRGRDLAAAIRAEHAARGKGKGVGQPGGGRSGAQSKSESYGKPDSPGKSEKQSKSETPSKSEKKGGPR